MEKEARENICFRLNTFWPNKKNQGREWEWSTFKVQYRIKWNQKRCKAELRISDHESELRGTGRRHLNKLLRKSLLFQIMVPVSKDKATLEVGLSKCTTGIRAPGGIYTLLSEQWSPYFLKSKQLLRSVR